MLPYPISCANMEDCLGEAGGVCLIVEPFVKGAVSLVGIELSTSLVSKSAFLSFIVESRVVARGVAVETNTTNDRERALLKVPLAAALVGFGTTTSKAFLTAPRPSFHSISSTFNRVALFPYQHDHLYCVVALDRTDLLTPSARGGLQLPQRRWKTAGRYAAVGALAAGVLAAGAMAATHSGRRAAGSRTGR